MSFKNNNILIIDVECSSLNINEAKLKWFGAYSYCDDKYYLIPFKNNEKDIVELIKRHKILVSFNGKSFDIPIIHNNINEPDLFNYKVIIDLLEISAPKSGKDYAKFRKNRLVQMGYKLKNFTLKNIAEKLKLDDEGTKGDIDYKIFQKDEWTSEEIEEIKKYLKQDIVLTKKLLEWYETQYSPLKKFLPEKDQENLLYIKSSLSVLAYNIICNKAGLTPDYTDATENKSKSFAGGHHIEPRWELVKGNIVSIDFACLHKDTEVITPTGNKKISNLISGDFVKGINGYEKVAFINKKKVKKLYKITLESGEIVYATPEHKFPIKKIGDKRVDELKIGDDMITIKIKKKNVLRLERKCVICNKNFLVRVSQINRKYCSKKCYHISVKGNGNPNFKNKLYEKHCPVCDKKFKTRDCVGQVTCGDKKCVSFMLSKNNPREWLGKTKENTPQLMKMSLSKLGKKRTKKHKKNISEGTKRKMRENWDVILPKIQSANRDFMKNPAWILKNQQSRHNNIKKGKWKYKNIKFRSSWEKKFAILLDKNNIVWKYEPSMFTFKYENKLLRYLPDFYLPDYKLWIEIKGWKSDLSMLKYNLFKEKYKSVLIDKKSEFENEIQKIKNKKY